MLHRVTYSVRKRRLNSGRRKVNKVKPDTRPSTDHSRLRGRRRVVGAAYSVRPRLRTAGGRGVHRCQHVPDHGRDRGDVAPGCGSRSGLHLRYVVHASNRDGGPRGASRDRASGRRGAGNGTSFISFFMPAEMLTLARDAGFREVQLVSAAMLGQRYFASRTDDLRPPNNSEELLVATT